jgi:4-hydroxy-tetrahydrodipicolinate reductase
MRIGIHGAAGRVGTRLLKLIQADPGMELAAALVSPTSPLVGMQVDGSRVEYRPSDASVKAITCDVIIDFSKPAASLDLQKDIGATHIPVVIGTTGFSDEQERMLTNYATHRPLLVSANFARGFEAMRRAADDFARQLADADASVAETYHARKKNEPSGTSLLLADVIRQARSGSKGAATLEIPIVVHRQGDVVGINEVRFDMGSAEILVRYGVRTLDAYAEGALLGAKWLVSRSPAPGRFSLADTIQSSQTI